LASCFIAEPAPIGRELFGNLVKRSGDRPWLLSG
jgi:hypothetical protein